MRVYGLRLPIKSQGWLMGVICFGIALLYPPFANLPTYGNVPFIGLSGYGDVLFDGTAFGWRYDFAYMLRTGGLIWHILAYLRWQNGMSPVSDRMLVALFAPYCLVPVTLSLCTLILWRFLVNYAPRPTILRGVLTVLCALFCSLGLDFVLDQVGGRIVIYGARISYMANLEIRSLIANIWITVVLQSVLLALPCLVVGGLLAWRQSRLETQFSFARAVPTVASQDE